MRVSRFLEEHRACEPPAPCAQGEADREFAAARLGAHEEQVGNAFTQATSARIPIALSAARISPTTASGAPDDLGPANRQSR